MIDQMQNGPHSEDTQHAGGAEVGREGFLAEVAFEPSPGRRTHFPRRWTHLWFGAVFDDCSALTIFPILLPAPHSPSLHRRVDFQINRRPQSCSKRTHSCLPLSLLFPVSEKLPDAIIQPQDIPSLARERAIVAKLATGRGSPQRREKVPGGGGGTHRSTDYKKT